jgi:organic radical activating enzyme
MRKIDRPGTKIPTDMKIMKRDVKNVAKRVRTKINWAIGSGATAHAFDNFPLDQWLQAFRRHFANHRLSLVISGGEPLLDKKNMPLLLTAFHEMPEVECIRIDTNTSWKLDWYSELDKSKMILMCTYHPTQVDEQQFFEKIHGLLDSGFQIGMINYVMTPQQRDRYYVCKARCRE